MVETILNQNNIPYSKVSLGEVELERNFLQKKQKRLMQS